MNEDFSHILDALPKSGIREFFDLVSNSSDIISLGVGEPDFPTPWTIREEAVYALEKGMTSYTSNQGLEQLREAIADYLKNRFSVQRDPEHEILITNGGSEGADIVLRSLLNPGDNVIIPKPMYVCYDPLVKLTGATVTSINTAESNFIPDPKAIEKAITKKTKALILCYPNNPTGMSIPKKTLEAIAKLVEKHDLWVISDEIYAELSYNGKSISFASLPNMAKRTILLSGFSKAFAMTGWRIGYIAAPKALTERACKIHQYSALCASIIAQVGAIEALKNAMPELEKMRRSYDERRQYFVSELNALGLPTLMPEGALYCFPDIRPTGLSSRDFALAFLKEQQVATVPGTAFGEEGEGYVRCCFATKHSELKKAIARLKKFLEKRV